MKDSSNLSSKFLFLALTSLRIWSQSICSPIGLALTIIDPKVVSRELLSLANLTRAQALCIHEPTKIIMVVGEHKNFVLTAFQIVPPILEGLNDG